MSRSLELSSDLRATQPFGDVESLYDALWAAGTGQAFDASDLQAAGDGLLFTGIVCGPGALQGHQRRIERLADSGERTPWGAEVRLVRAAGVHARLAAVVTSACGADQLRVQWQDGPGGSDRWAVPGRVEHLEWAPDGSALLVQVAGSRADFAGIAGGRKPQPERDGPSWLPRVEGPVADADAGRSVWIWPPGRREPRPLTGAAIHPWEATWHGPDAVLVVGSDGPGEDRWYAARLLRVALDGSVALVRTPQDQIGGPCASPDGHHAAWIEAVCSDRGLVCGTAWLASGPAPPRRLDLGDLEATHLQWRDERRLVVAGMCSLETAVLELDVQTGQRTTIWRDDVLTLGGWQPRAVPVGRDAVAAVVEGYGQPPRVVELSPGGTRTLAALAGGNVAGIGRLQPVAWAAADGLEIHGWLVLPDDTHRRPARGWPLLVDAHGGPIHAHRSRWAANLRSVPALAARGWAVLLANPRGSSGRGQAFARRVVGDMGGADAQDLLAGVDHLIGTGVVDASRVAVTGCSYGGFMSCWLPTQSRRFAAAVAISPVTHWPSQHYGSHIPWFDARFLGSHPQVEAGPYHRRSPVHFASACRTPVLLMAGLQDRSTPPEQAQHFHAALQESGGHGVLVSYHEEGHSLRGPQGYIDSAARCIDWLEQHAGAERSGWRSTALGG